jgi:hypothetical protein
MSKYDKLEKLVIAIDPDTQRPRVFQHAGYNNVILGQPKLELYRAFEGTSKMYTLRQLKSASYIHELPILVYNLVDTLPKPDRKQGELFK